MLHMTENGSPSDFFRFLLGRNMTAIDACTMSDRYLDAVLADADVQNLPMVLAHDGQQPARAASIARTYGAVSYRGEHGTFVDMLLLLRSSFMIGHPASTMAGNAATARGMAGLRSNLGDTKQWYRMASKQHMGRWAAPHTTIQFGDHDRQTNPQLTPAEVK